MARVPSAFLELAELRGGFLANFRQRCERAAETCETVMEVCGSLGFLKVGVALAYVPLKGRGWLP